MKKVSQYEQVYAFFYGTLVDPSAVDIRLIVIDLCRPSAGPSSLAHTSTLSPSFLVIDGFRIEIAAPE